MHASYLEEAHGAQFTAPVSVSRLCLLKTPSSDFPFGCNIVDSDRLFFAAPVSFFLNVTDFNGIRTG